MHQPLTYEVNGDAIREERMQAGMSRTELAHLAGISPRYVAHLENGTRRHMGPASFKRLRDALNTPPDRIQKHRPTRQPPPERT